MRAAQYPGRSTPVMRHRVYHDFVGLAPVDDRKWESSNTNPAKLVLYRRSRVWESFNISDCRFNGVPEALAEVRTLGAVVFDLAQKFKTCGSDEAS
jgi:hypothetical protein